MEQHLFVILTTIRLHDLWPFLQERPNGENVARIWIAMPQIRSDRRKVWQHQQYTLELLKPHLHSQMHPLSGCLLRLIQLQRLC